MRIYCNPRDLLGTLKQAFFRQAADKKEIICFGSIDMVKQFVTHINKKELNKYFGVCVVSNGSFDVAAVMYPVSEYTEFSVNDDKPKTYYACTREWLINKDPSLDVLLPK